MKNIIQRVGDIKVSKNTANALTLLPAIATATALCVSILDKTPYQEIMNTTWAPLRVETACLTGVKKCEPISITLPSMNEDSKNFFKTIRYPYKIDKVVVNLPGNEIPCEIKTIKKSPDLILEKLGVKGAPAETVNIISCDARVAG